MNKTYQQFSGDKTTGWRNDTELENGKRASENSFGKRKSIKWINCIFGFKIKLH